MSVLQWMYIYCAVALTLLGVEAQFYYRDLKPFEALDQLRSCIKPPTEGVITCALYKVTGVNIEATCLANNVVRIVGEYNTIRIICSSPDALDFRYYGIQPTEAIKVEWYKNVAPFTNGSISEFGVDVQVRSVEALYKYYSNKGKAKPAHVKHDYPRSGNYVFRGIYKNETELSIFVYFEDSGIPSFLRNMKTKITLRDSEIQLPCILSHYGRNVSVEFTNSDGAVKSLDVAPPIDAFRGFRTPVIETEISNYYGVYTCIWNDNHQSDRLTLEFNADSAARGYRFGMNGTIPTEARSIIRYYLKDTLNGVEIQVSCKVHDLHATTQLVAIEAENFAMMNLKREFVFPVFANRSYRAISKRTSGELSFKVNLDEKFYTRYGGATYCKSGNDLQIVEFAVPFVGEVSERVFDTEWPFFDRRTSDIQIHFQLKLLGESSEIEVYAETKRTFECKLIIAIVVKPAIWTTIWQNGTRIEERVDYNWTGPLEDTSKFTIQIHQDLVGVECSATFYYASFWRHISIPLEVKSGEPPKIDSQSRDLTLRIGALNQGITCSASGKPIPKLSWYKAGSQLFASLTANGTLLHQIQKVESSHGGEYVCKAENIYGTDEKTFTYTVEGDEVAGNNYGILIGVPVVVFLITLIGAAVYVKFIRKEQVGLTRAEIEDFLAGDKEIARNSVAYAHEFAHLTPYDQSYELSDNKYQIDSTDILGTGAYGVVYKGIVDGKPVAVKTTKKNSDKAYLKALLSELKIMIYLGQHENIVQLIGASTKSLDIGVVYIFVPFCGLGNLEKFLRSNRHLYAESADMEYKNLENGMFGYNDLMTWAIQIADGMEYLASRKVIHGDLAARNILLTETKQAKITDFGLSRQLYGYESYVKKHQEPLPWRWMAIESLRYLSFSTLSDVWSYGVLLWEIFSLGEVPYPGMAWTVDFVDELENGLRMSRPKRLPESIYVNILFLCWHKNPAQRPSFADIKESLAELHCSNTATANEQTEKVSCSLDEMSMKQPAGNVYSNRN